MQRTQTCPSTAQTTTLAPHRAHSQNHALQMDLPLGNFSHLPGTTPPSAVAATTALGQTKETEEAGPGSGGVTPGGLARQNSGTRDRGIAAPPQGRDAAAARTGTAPLQGPLEHLSVACPRTSEKQTLAAQGPHTTACIRNQARHHDTVQRQADLVTLQPMAGKATENHLAY
jgi:hypothetical protein